MQCQHLQPLPLFNVCVVLQECCQQRTGYVSVRVWVYEVGVGAPSIIELLVLSSDGSKRWYKSSAEVGIAGVLIESRHEGSDIPHLVSALHSRSPCGQKKTPICSHYQPSSDLITVLQQFDISFYPLWLNRLCPKYVLQWSAHGSQTHTHTYCGLRSPVKTKAGSASVSTGHCYGHSLPSRIFAPCGGPGFGEVMYWRCSQSVQLYKGPRTHLAYLCDRTLPT